MKSGLKGHHIKRYVSCAVVATIAPMKRGLKVIFEKVESKRYVDMVATIAPTKRGLKVEDAESTKCHERATAKIRRITFREENRERG